MASGPPLLSVEGLCVEFATEAGILRAVDGIDLAVERGETLALVGESGCGKTMTALAIMGLVPEPAGRIAAGHISFDGVDLQSLAVAERRAYRGSRIAMIFQEPMTSLNPAFTIGLLGAVPRLAGGRSRLATIEGNVPDPLRLPPGCRFAPRCPFAEPRCHAEDPRLVELDPGHRAACLRAPLDLSVLGGRAA